jgi:hypothetical protein
VAKSIHGIIAHLIQLTELSQLLRNWFLEMRARLYKMSLISLPTWISGEITGRVIEFVGLSRKARSLDSL